MTIIRYIPYLTSNVLWPITYSKNYSWSITEFYFFDRNFVCKIIFYYYVGLKSIIIYLKSYFFIELSQIFIIDNFKMILNSNSIFHSHYKIVPLKKCGSSKQRFSNCMVSWKQQIYKQYIKIIYSHSIFLILDL